MCGITGWVSFDRDLTREEGALEAMTESMTARGPDGFGTWYSRHAALGHRRLAIIDLEGGAQPVTARTLDGVVALTYSGEVYNFAELRAELRRRGHPFRTACDTEVVLRAYLEWGTALTERLVGMYAFAVWDGRSEQLLLVRDRLGIKPLYYYPTPDGVLFGSEPKAVLANPAVPRTVDLDGIREIVLGVKTPGAAVWQGMRELPPGHVVTVSRLGVREQEYWRLRALPHTDDLATTSGRLRELLHDSVREQLVADVPRCLLVSGGLDSSTLAGLASEGRAAPLRSFSVDFAGHSEHFVPDEYNISPDAPYVRAVVDHLGTDHTDLVLDPAALADPEVRRACVSARDLPVGRGDLDHSLYLLFRAIREHSTVALSGEGADEMFGGYWWFHDRAVSEAAGFPWLTAALGTARQERPYTPPDLRAVLDIPEFAAQRYRDALAETPVLDGESAEQRRARQLLYLHMTRSLGGMLDRKDRLSMAVGLEVRVPFCDHRVAEYAFNIPWSMQVFDGREKSVLRAAAREVVPDVVLGRTKSPYPMTQDRRYVSALQEQVRGVLALADHDVFTLVDRPTALRAAEADPTRVPHPGRHRMLLEKVLDLYVWLDHHRPKLIVG
ncbi:asparagine synthase (glutamine-hydrolyzing) [Streptomyces sp. NRRL S-920]|uniref:asparagine synthase (glutamine-hydrolyzing) n=1 Tax=Streptomyces sp. NRRL S-920 TaxID=1463921 RepID=UPI0004C4C8B5|nr:asparagine synthase (glutamine-hydrolyzing) [Streptomyces sp. NRRL S-920]